MRVEQARPAQAARGLAADRLESQRAVGRNGAALDRPGRGAHAVADA
jgi:hypothetical protein